MSRDCLGWLAKSNLIKDRERGSKTALLAIRSILEQHSGDFSPPPRTASSVPAFKHRPTANQIDYEVLSAESAETLRKVSAAFCISI
jgi:hypothetical protein